MSPGLASQWTRLRRAYAATEGRRAGRKLTLLLMGGLLVAVAVHRIVGTVPGLERLERHPLVALLAVACAYVASLAVGRVLGLFDRPEPRLLARRLDDVLEWRDGLDAAASVEGTAGRDAERGAMGELVEARAAGRLAAVDARDLWPPYHATRRLPFCTQKIDK